MIWVRGVEYGTAAEIAHRLGLDVTAGMVRRWADRDGLPAHRTTGRGRGTVRYPLPEAARIEAIKRDTSRGRPRQLDTGRIAA